MNRIYHPEKEKRRSFAIAALGQDRWYWVVWPSLAEIRATEKAHPHVGEGYEKTKPEAIIKALEVAGRHAEWIPSSYARIYHRDKESVSSTAINPRATDHTRIPKLQEFLYRDIYDTERKQWVPVPHRVVRRTRKFVFVEQHPYSPDDASGKWLEWDYPSFRLDRRMLEKEGYAFVPATAYVEDAEEIYFSNEREKPPEFPQFKCIQALNLTWPCTEAQVKGAYRKLVKIAHPDGGGSQDKFLALQEDYEQALKLCRRHSTKSNPPKKEKA